MINNNWVFGNGAGISFTNGVQAFSAQPMSTGSTFSTDEGCASISDASGALLFYTDGIKVWDGNHIFRANLGLNGNKSASQSAIIVPCPGKDDEFFIFTVGAESGTAIPSYSAAKLMGTKLRIVQNQLTWSVTPLTGLPAALTGVTEADMGYTERLTAVQANDCRTFWVLTTIRSNKVALMGSSLDSSSTTTNTGNIGLGPVGQPTLTPVSGSSDHVNYGHLAGRGFLRAIEVGANGVIRVVDSDLIATRDGILISHHGYLRVSPDRTRIAIANGLLENVVVANFDVTNGTISGARVFGLDRASLATNNVVSDSCDLIVYGVEFSPNSAIVYASATTHRSESLVTFGDANCTTMGLLFTANASLPTGSNMTFLLKEDAVNEYGFGALQRGPDNVIYVARDGETALGAILNPNTPDANNYVPMAVHLTTGTTCRLGLPNLLPAPCPVNDCDCGEEHECECGCGCGGCNEADATQNAELFDRAVKKFKDSKWGATAIGNVETLQCTRAVGKDKKILPHFHFSYLDSATDRIEAMDTEIVYLTVSNPYHDIELHGVRLKHIRISGDHRGEHIQIVPDMQVYIDCIQPCSSVSREFVLFTRSGRLPGMYKLEVDFCIDEVVLLDHSQPTTAVFQFEVVKG